MKKIDASIGARTAEVLGNQWEELSVSGIVELPESIGRLESVIEKNLLDAEITELLNCRNSCKHCQLRGLQILRRVA